MTYFAQLKTLVRATKLLGPLRGPAAFSTSLLYRRSKSRRWARKELRIPELQHPILYRPGTSDWDVIESVLMEKEYNFAKFDAQAQAMAIYHDRILSQGKTPIILDCGANIGLSAIWFANAFPSAAVIAVEPEPENFDLLTLNSRPYSNIMPIRAGVCPHRTRIRLQNENGEPWAWKTSVAEDGDTEGLTIPDLLSRVADGVPFIFKIDIEGAEGGLFEGNPEWAQKVPLIVIETHDWQLPWSGTGHAVFSCLSSEKKDYMQVGASTFAFSHALLVSGRSMDTNVLADAVAN